MVSIPLIDFMLLFQAMLTKRTFQIFKYQINQ